MPVMVKCAWCGKEVEICSARLKYKNHFCNRECMSKYYSKYRSGENHNQYKGKIKVECANCGKEIEVYPSRIKRYKERNSKFYCSKECKKEYWQKNRRGENNPRTKARADVICPQCGKLFKIPKWRVNKAKQHFCSRECLNLWCQQNALTGERHHSYKKESHRIIKCEQCGKEFEINTSQLRRFKRHFCSRECKDEYQKGKYFGKRTEYQVSICEVCGKEFRQPKNRKNQKKTCSNECAIKLRSLKRDKKITLICHYCGKKYKVHKCEEDRSKYCSRTCLTLAKMATIHSGTLPERKTKEALESLGVKFEYQYPIDQMVVDFYLPEIKTVLEVFGDYWHANPLKYDSYNLDDIQKKNIARDKRRMFILRKMGYDVKFVWENDIKNDPIEAIKNALSMN